MNKTVYIIIPIYNTELYLKRCLDSVFNQTYDNIRVICVNDGSTDGSSSILKEYANHQNLTVIHKDNGGPSSARNTGLDYIKDKQDCYIAFIDADDYVDYKYIETLVKLLEQNDCDIVASSFYFASSSNNKRYHQIDKDTVLSNIDATCLLLEDKTVQSHSHCKLYKKCVWDYVRYPVDIVSMEDQATIYKTFLNTNKVFISDYTGYYYWQDSPSICRSKMTNKKVLDSIKGYYESVIDPLLHLETKAKEKVHQAAIQGCFPCFLMMFPRFSSFAHAKKNLDIIQMERIIKKYQPISNINRFEKIVFCISPKIYFYLYRIILSLR